MADRTQRENPQEPSVTDSSRAVFLSYASQDSDAASRICDALRAAGIEVWYDQRELRGGDAWDRNIRREIRDCALFLPIISANTQARIEGYFRLEWRLADQRTHLMGKSRTFLVPVCIDDTRDADADVPDSFAAVQWTRLKRGESPRVFVERISRLLIPDDASRSVAVRPATSDVFPLADRPAWPAEAAVSEKSIAVLPFADMSLARDHEYFSDGLAEALIDLLTQVRDLRVPARTSSFSFKEKSDDIASIAIKLRVSHILEGSVRKSGSTIRITARLIRGDTGFHLWSKTYDRSMEDIFKVQDEIAALVVEALKAQLLPADGVINAHRTTNTHAYEQYLLARQLFNRRTLDSIEQALIALRRAIDLDPNYASAHALFAMISFASMLEGLNAAQANAELAISAAERAVALAPGLAEAYSARAFVRLTMQWDWSKAQADVEKALQLDPRSDGVQRRYSQHLAVVGRFHEAIVAAQAAIEIDPLDANAWSFLGAYRAMLGQFNAAHEALRQSLQLSPQSTFATFYLATSELAAGHAAEALDTNKGQQHEPRRYAVLAMAGHVLGRAEESQRALNELIAKYGEVMPYLVAKAHAWRGELDSAFEWLERAYRCRDVGLCFFVRGDIELSGLRSDPRYEALLRKMNLAE